MKSAMVLGAYNIALAEKQGLDLCALCSSCTSQLTEVVHHLAHDDKAKAEVNEVLARAGLHYDKGVRVRHFARVLYEEVGKDEIKKHFTKSLEGLRIANHYGCHYLKPSEIYENFDQVEDPIHSMNWSLSRVPRWWITRTRNDAAGGPVLPVDEKTSLAIAKEKLDDIGMPEPMPSTWSARSALSCMTATRRGLRRNSAHPTISLCSISPNSLDWPWGSIGKELGLNMNVVRPKDALASMRAGIS